MKAIQVPLLLLCLLGVSTHAEDVQDKKSYKRLYHCLKSSKGQGSCIGLVSSTCQASPRIQCTHQEITLWNALVEDMKDFLKREGKWDGTFEDALKGWTSLAKLECRISSVIYKDDILMRQTVGSSCMLDMKALQAARLYAHIVNLGLDYKF